MDDEALTVEIHNAPGKNHAALVALLERSAGGSGSDGKDMDLMGCLPRTLSASGLGSSESSFQGLSEIRRAAHAMRPPAAVSLLATPDGMLFRLRAAVERAPPAPGPDATGAVPVAAADAPQVPPLPENMVFICADDDLIPRTMSDSLIETAKGHSFLSTVLGQDAEEARPPPPDLRLISP